MEHHSQPILPKEEPIRFEKELSVENIRYNELNPRKVFREKDTNDLCNSIIAMGGIIVPLVVYEVNPGRFVLLDGQRRLMAAKKLGMKHVPANVVSGRLSDEENLRTMFNIHMAREPWDPASRALALQRLKELNPGISIEQLANVTGMTRGALRDADRILRFPEDIIARCLHEGQPDYLRPANLVEMERAFETIEEYLPDFFEHHSRELTARNLIKKRDNMIIPRNTDFRLIKTMFAYLPVEDVRMLIERVIEEPDLGISDIYETVEDKINSKRFDLFRRSCYKFENTLKQFEFESLDKMTKVEAISLMEHINKVLSEKIRSLKG